MARGIGVLSEVLSGVLRRVLVKSEINSDIITAPRQASGRGWRGALFFGWEFLLEGVLWRGWLVPSEGDCGSVLLGGVAGEAYAELAEDFVVDFAEHHGAVNLAAVELWELLQGAAAELVAG